MCGICGIVALGGQPVEPVVLQRMNDRLAHRGPDGAGFLTAWSTGDGFRHALGREAAAATGGAPARVGLGHRRLAILDLSDRGLQPMAAPGGDVWIVFNGEIYNHLELRAQLRALGYDFTTRTDTEVLLQAYRQWGEECLPHLEGMFSFAIWDERRGHLFCARDRLGIKPFYYATPAGWFVFASEIKALLACPALQAVPDDEAVLGFLIHANCDYGERTVLRAVKALPPGHSLRLDVRSGQLTVRRYWELRPTFSDGRPDRHYLTRLSDLLTDAIRKHLISDVRAGSCLSGGIDSSSVVTLIGKLRREDPAAASAVGDALQTFTSCWEYKQFDERRYAQIVAQAAQTDSHLVFPTADDFWEAFPKMAWHQDMPFGQFTYYAQWRVMRAAKEAGVKVLLDGQGGDEVFGGYAKFRYAYFASLLRSRRFARLATELGATVLQGDLYVLDLRKGYRYLPRGLRRWLGVDSLLRDVLRSDWNQAVLAESTPATRWWRYARTTPPGGTSSATLMQRVQIDDITMDTLPHLLRMEDRSSMAFSLEARVPLLDHRIVEYGVSLPDQMKVRRGWSKYAVREALSDVLPDVIRRRKTKLGFAAPNRAWLTGALRPRVTELLADRLRCERYVDVPALRRWYDSPQSRRANTESYLGLFRVLALEMWMRGFDLR